MDRSEQHLVEPPAASRSLETLFELLSRSFPGCLGRPLTASWSGTAGRLQHSSRVTRARSDRSRSSRRGGGPCAAQELQADGYDVGKLPEEEGDLIKSVLNDETARFNSADLNVAYKMDVPEYQRLCPYAEALEENWGKAPGDCSSALQPLWHGLPCVCYQPVAQANSDLKPWQKITNHFHC